MYSALKVAMVSDHAYNMTTIWKNVYAADGGEISKKTSDSQDITVEDIEGSTDGKEIAEEGAAGKSFVFSTTNAHFQYDPFFWTPVSLHLIFSGKRVHFKNNLICRRL